MIKGCKICGISDPKTLIYIVDHPHPPQFIGFIESTFPDFLDVDKLCLFREFNMA